MHVYLSIFLHMLMYLSIVHIDLLLRGERVGGEGDRGGKEEHEEERGVGTQEDEEEEERWRRKRATTAAREVRTTKTRITIGMR